jgi:hypothetical protein
MKKCCDSKDTIEPEHIDLKNLDGLICYCFKHSKKKLFLAAQNGQQDTIISDIKEKMKDPGCFCETANPSGKCCLNDVLEFVKAVQKNS